MKLRAILLGTLFLAFAAIAEAQSVKNVHHTFDADESTTLSIRNSFGEIDIEPYEGSKIEVDITISIEPKNGKKLEEYFEKVKIEVNESGNLVSLRTINDLNKGSWKVKNFDVDYSVRIPKGTNLKLVNSFGDIKIHGADGYVDINVQHGDCYIAEAGPERNMLRLSFGDLRIKNIGNADIRVQHGDMSLGKVGEVDIELQFGDGTIEYLDGNGKMRVSHGEMNIQKINNSIENLFIDAQFSDIEIGGVDGGDFILDMSGSFSDFDFDSSWYTKKKIKDYNTEEYLIFTKGEQAGGGQIGRAHV